MQDVKIFQSALSPKAAVNPLSGKSYMGVGQQYLLISVAVRREARYETAFLDTIHAEPCTRLGSTGDFPYSLTECQHCAAIMRNNTQPMPLHLKRTPPQKWIDSRCSAGFQQRARKESSTDSSHWDVFMPPSRLTDDQIRHVEQIAMHYLEKHVSINNTELRGLSGISYDQATYFFNRMLKIGRASCRERV